MYKITQRILVSFALQNDIVKQVSLKIWDSNYFVSFRNAKFLSNLQELGKIRKQQRLKNF